MPRRPLPREVDVLVVGGGMSGVSLLRDLCRRGIRAALVEKAHLAFGASGRNAGFLLTGTSHNFASAVDRYGAAVAAKAWQFTADNHALLTEALAGRAPYRRLGSDTVALDAAEAAELERAAALLAEAGLAQVDYRDSRLHNPLDGEVDPAAAVAALAADCPPGSIHEWVEVPSLEDLPVRAGAVALCTNAYTPLLLPEAPIAPVRAQMLATAPDPARLAVRPTYAGWGYRYWRQLAGGELLIGGWRDTAVADEVGYDLRPTAGVQAAIEKGARSLGATAAVTHRWAGTMGFTPDALPLVGPWRGRPGLYVCAGFTGHGMAFAFNSARALGAHLAGGPPPPSWLSPSREQVATAS